MILGYNSEIECLYIKAPEFEPQFCRNKQKKKKQTAHTNKMQVDI